MEKRPPPLPNKDGEEDGALYSHEMGMFSLSLDSLQKTAGCPRECLWKGRLSGEQVEGKERNQETTNAQDQSLISGLIKVSCGVSISAAKSMSLHDPAICPHGPEGPVLSVPCSSHRKLVKTVESR